MQRHRLLAYALALALLCASALPQAAQAADPQRGIESALAAAMEAKRGITLAVGGQMLGGAVVKIDSGGVVELRGPQGARITVRIDRIDAVTLP